jgi:hypothetical protein
VRVYQSGGCLIETASASILRYAQTRHHPFWINAIGTGRRFLENGGKQHEYFSHGRPAEIISSADRAISPDNLQESKDRPRKALSV